MPQGENWSQKQTNKNQNKTTKTTITKKHKNPIRQTNMQRSKLQPLDPLGVLQGTPHTEAILFPEIMKNQLCEQNRNI